MLILSRKQGERIVLTMGNLKVEVLVTDILNDRVKLGIDAPSEVKIHREEVFEAIARERQQ